jgi:cobalt-precorrin 5A hydrolase
MERGAMRVAGIGCRAESPPATLRNLLSEAGPLDLVAGLLTRTGQVQPVAAGMGLRFFAVDEGALRGTVTPTVSPRVGSRFGTGSVAEATALIAAGRNARIVAVRRVSPDATATIAIAEGDGP